MNSTNSPADPVIPSAGQLAAARLKQWHQDGEALLTFENLRSWINVAGFALYAPRQVQLPVPAPTMVEAVLGASNPAPSIAEFSETRSLLARLIAEGAAVPLNLLGSPTGVGTDTPDFIAATAILPYIFTLRGDKSWKLPPATTGAGKVSTLALNTYTLLAEKTALSASALATDLGKEVTEAAVLRALTELWTHLRVLPIAQPDGSATLWELTSARFTKQLKAGSNAGQPTALSALISLYLGQAIVASEEDIQTFLSPLAARSRIRDVVHALLNARQIETLAIDGRTVLHVAGDLPAFLAAPALPLTHLTEEHMAVPVDDIGPLVLTTEGAPRSAGATAETAALGAVAALDSDAPAPRIRKFIPAPRKLGTGFVTKPGLNKPARKPFAAPASPRERRPFTRESNRPDRPSFTKPWAEEKADRLAKAASPSSLPGDIAASATPEFKPRERRPFTDRKPSSDRKPAFDGKPSFAKRPAFGSKPAYDRKPGFDRKPSYDRKSASGSKPSFDRKPSFGGKPSFDRKPAYDRKPASDRKPSDDRKSESDSRPSFDRKPAFGSKPGFDRKPRPDSKTSFERKPTYGSKPFAGKPAFNRDRSEARPPRRDFAPRPDANSGDFPPRKKTFSKPGTFARKRDSAAAESTGPRYRKFDAPRSPRPTGQKSDHSHAASDQRKTSSYPSKSTKLAGKKPGKPAGTFDKFKNNAKPFGKRPPARKWKPDESKPSE